MKNSVSVTKQEFNRRLKKVTNLLRTLILAFFFIIGVVSFNALDIFLGGVTYSSAMQDMPVQILGLSISGEVIGWALSITFWFIQYIAWKRILEDGKITIKDIPVLGICLFLGFGDTVGDVAPVYLYVSSSNFVAQAMAVPMWGTTLGTLLLGIIQYSVMLMTFFSEAINSFIFYDVDDKLFSFNMPKVGNKKTTHTNHNLRGKVRNKKQKNPFQQFGGRP